MVTFKTSRNIPASPESIFAAFSDPERLAKWWGPSGFSNTFSHIQFSPGGKWSFVMHGPDGKNYPNESEFVEVVPEKMIVIRHISEPQFILTVVIAKTESGSVVDWIQDFDDDKVARNIAHIVEPSNEQNLERLSKEVSGL